GGCGSGRGGVKCARGALGGVVVAGKGQRGGRGGALGACPATRVRRPSARCRETGAAPPVVWMPERRPFASLLPNQLPKVADLESSLRLAPLYSTGNPDRAKRQKSLGRDGGANPGGTWQFPDVRRRSSAPCR